MTNEEIIRVKLGIPIASYHMDGESRLFVAGTALEEGVWIGMDGIPRFYSRSVIQAGASLFNGTPLVCEHRRLKIGDVVQVEATELGFRIKEAYITDPASIQAVLTGQKIGLSIEGTILVNPVKLTVDQIVKAENISLVADPACRVCGITDAHLVNESSGPLSIQNSGIKIMVDENVNEESVVPENLEAEETASLANGETDAIEITTIEEAAPDNPADQGNSIFDELKLAAEKFKSLRQKLTEMLLSDRQVVQLSLPETSSEVVETVTTETEVVTVENVQEEITAFPYEEFEQMKAALSSATCLVTEITEQFDQFGQSIADLQAKVQILNEAKVALAAKESEEKTDLIRQIFEIDPETDNDFVSGMTVTQLSSYKTKIASFKKPVIGGSKSSVKRDASTTATKQPELTREAIVSEIIASLKTKQS